MLAVTGFLDRAVVVEYVARSRAISQFADGVFAIGVFRFLMRTGFVIIRVTTGTIRLICWLDPRGYLGVGTMTVGTIQTAGMA